MQNTTNRGGAVADAPFWFRSVALLTGVLTLLGAAALNSPGSSTPRSALPGLPGT